MRSLTKDDDFLKRKGQAVTWGGLGLLCLLVSGAELSAIMQFGLHLQHRLQDVETGIRDGEHSFHCLQDAH